MVQFFLSELMEEIDLDNFLKEDQATLVKRGRESMAQVVGELRDYLQHECGGRPMSFVTSCFRYIHVFTSFQSLQL